MSRPNATLEALSSEGTFVFTVEQDCFLFFYMAVRRVERDTLTRLFNRRFGTSLSEWTIARRAYRLSCHIGGYSVLP